MAEYTKAQLTEMIVGKLRRNFGRDVDDATPNHMFKACALVRPARWCSVTSCPATRWRQAIRCGRASSARSTTCPWNF